MSFLTSRYNPLHNQVPIQWRLAAVGTQSIPDSSVTPNWTGITLPTNAIDNYGAFDPGHPTWLITPNAAINAWGMVLFEIAWETTSSVGFRAVRLMGGSTTPNTLITGPIVQQAPPAIPAGLSAAGLFHQYCLTIGATQTLPSILECQVYQNSGAALNIHTDGVAGPQVMTATFSSVVGGKVF